MFSESNFTCLGISGNERREPRCRAGPGLLQACVGQAAGLDCYALHVDAHRTNRRARSKTETAWFGMPRKGQKEASGGDLVFSTFILTMLTRGHSHPKIESSCMLQICAFYSCMLYYHKNMVPGSGAIVQW